MAKKNQRKEKAILCLLSYSFCRKILRFRYRNGNFDFQDAGAMSRFSRIDIIIKPVDIKTAAKSSAIVRFLEGKRKGYILFDPVYFQHSLCLIAAGCGGYFRRSEFDLRIFFSIKLFFNFCMAILHSVSGIYGGYINRHVKFGIR